MTDFLYHYTTFDKFITGILKTNSIRLNSIQNVNDPLDSKIRYFQSDQVIFSSQDEGKEYYKRKEKYLELINEKWLKQSKIACFSIDNLKDGIFGYQLSNLWSYYAENHMGLCLKLDKRKLLSQFQNKYEKYTPLAGEIKYKDRISPSKYRLDYDSNQILGIKENKDALFFEKLKVWDREQEYRLICFSTNDYEYISLDSSLEEIIMGQECNKGREELLKYFFSDSKISKMNYFIGDGKFEKVNIKDDLWQLKS